MSSFQNFFFQLRSVYAPMNVIPERGGGAEVGILIRHSSPREWLLTLWTGPRVRRFDFSLSLSRGREVLTVAYIPGRQGTSCTCFVSRWRRLLMLFMEEEVCNLIKLMRSSIHQPLFLTSVRRSPFLGVCIWY